MADNETDPFADSLLELAGVDLTGVAEVRFETLPPMKAGFEVVEVGKRGRDTDKGPRLFIEVKAKVLEVLSVADAKFESAEAKEKLVGKTFSETFVIDPNDPLTGIGRFKAFLKDIGTNDNAKLGDLFAGSLNGFKLLGTIKHRPNPKDKDRPFTNLVPTKTSASGAIKV